MKRVSPAIRTVSPSINSPRHRPRFGSVPTLTEDASLWKANRLADKAATTRSFRALRPLRRRSAKPGIISRLAHNVMVALGIW